MSENAIPMLRVSAPAELRFRVEEIFSPSTPVARRDLFAGRTQALQALEAVLTRAGRHAVVFGERGTGKTSLVTLLAELTGRPLTVAQVSAQPGDTFGTLWSRVAEQLRLTAARAERGLTLAHLAPDVATGAPIGAAWTPEATITLAERATANGPAVIVFDDFQNFTKPAEKHTFATILAALTTLSPALTVIVTGTAQSAEGLLAGTGEFATPVHVTRLSPEECREVLARAGRVLDLTFEDGVAARIATLSNGLPQVVQALGLAAARVAAGERTTIVTDAQLPGAVHEVVGNVDPETLHAYDQATVRARRGIYPEILLACALAPRDSHGTYNVADVRAALQFIVRREVRGLTNQVAALTEEGRGAVVEKLGLASAARYRFVNPALEPYILMRGLEEGWATSRAPVWLPAATEGAGAREAA
jgi:hypothetical protein